MSRWLERLVERVSPDTHRAPEPGRPHAAVAALLHDDRVLLMKRAAREGDPWSGHISLPGGRHDPRDADLLATAIREADEELGLALGDARLLGTLPVLSPFTSGPTGITVTPFVFATERAVEPRLSPEAVAAFWLPLSLAQSGALAHTYTYPGTTRTFPAWKLDDHVIWGLTYRILSDLMGPSDDGPRTSG